MLPEFPEHRHLSAGDIVRNWDAGEFDNAAFDGIHQRKVAHRPGKQGALGIAGTAQKKRRRGQVNHPRDAKFAA